MTNAARSDEIRLLSAQIKNGAITPLIDKYLDDLLRWLAGTDTDTYLETGFSRLGIDPGPLRVQLIQLLDQHLFHPDNSSYSVLGLAPGAGQPEIKARYHRLLKVFHPDRQHEDLAWWTDRAERLNRAYAALKSGKATGEVAVEISKRATRQPYGHYPQGDYGSAAMGRVRQSLGRGRQFQIRFFTAAVLVSAGVLFYIYSRNAPLDTLERDRATAQPTVPASQQSMTGHVVHRLKAVENTDRALVSHAATSAAETAINNLNDEPQVPTQAAIEAIPQTDDTTEPPVTELAAEAELAEQPAADALLDATTTAWPLEEALSEISIREQKPNEIQMDLTTAGLDVTAQEVTSTSIEKPSAPPAKAQQMRPTIPAQRPTPGSIENAPVPIASIGRSAAGSEKAELNETQIAKTTITDPTEAINGLFDQFSTWYRQGNIQDLTELFLEDAVDGGDIGKTRIKDAYQKIFDGTTSREVSFFIDNIESREENTFLVEARYRASLNYARRDPKVLEDDMKVWIEKSGDAYKFKRLVYAK